MEFIGKIKKIRKIISRERKSLTVTLSIAFFLLITIALLISNGFQFINGIKIAQEGAKTVTNYINEKFNTVDIRNIRLGGCPKMANYVLVHGGNMTTDTWNKLTKGNHVSTYDSKMGGRIWDPVVPVLKGHNHRIFAPTLKDEHSSNLTGHIEQVCALIAEHDLRDVILVGHSYGGMIITGVAARMADRVSHLVYVDAALPDPGQSLFDIIVFGGCDPLSFAGLEPAAPYVEKLQFDARKIKPLPKTYILCTESEFAPVTHVARKKIAAAGKEWIYVELPTSHVPMASMPDEFTQLLLEAAK
jgi:pimeloyl-ACP methyl ester carboxylesterase